jgi:hypothetical protein
VTHIDEIVLFGIAADIGKRQNHDGKMRRPLFSRCEDGLRVRRTSRPGLDRVDPQRPRDVLERLLAEIDEFMLQLVAHLPIGVFRQARSGRFADAFQTCCDIDAVAHQIAVALLDDNAQMNTDTKFDAAVLGHASVALNHCVLYFAGATHGVDDTAELDDRAVASALEHPPVMSGNRGVDQIAAQSAKQRESAILIRASHPAEADDIGRQDCRDLPRLSHGASPPPPRLAQPRNSSPVRATRPTLKAIAGTAAMGRYLTFAPNPIQSPQSSCAPSGQGLEPPFLSAMSPQPSRHASRHSERRRRLRASGRRYDRERLAIRFDVA